MRLIDAEALMNGLEKKKASPANIKYTTGFNDALMRFRSMVHSAPTIDAEPVRRGTWKLLPNGEGVCDQCHVLQKDVWDDDGWQRFCGCCGAKMDGGAEK